MQQFLLKVKLAVTIGILTGCGAAVYAAENTPPNIILILADDQGWTGLSTPMDPQEPGSRSDYYQTPNLDRLAREGMRFVQGYAPAPVCSPTRHSIQFGMSPAKTRVTHNAADLRQLCDPKLALANLIKAANSNYATAHFGKWHVSFSPAECGYDVSDGNTGNADGNSSEDPQDPKRVFGVTQRSIAFMEQQVAAKKPFFLQVSHYADHLMFRARPETVAKYQAMTPGEKHSDPAFAAMNDDLDAGVGRVLAALDQRGIADSTYVIYTADNGFDESPSADQRGKAWPLSYSKGFVWEGGVRVPFIVRGPGIKAGSVSRAPVIGYDVMPTVLDIIDPSFPLPEIVEGASLLPAFAGAGTLERPDDFFIFHYPTGTWPSQTSLIKGDYKAIKSWAYERVELFHLGSDLSELHDLSATMPEKAAELHHDMMAYLRGVNAVFPPQEELEIDRVGPLMKKGKEVRRSGVTKSTAEQGGKPNVLFIAIDDMNDWTTVFDPDNPIKTPNLERLAERGTFFSKAYCAVPGCNPSRTALLTGLLPTTSGVYTNGNPWREALPDAVTLPKYFQDNGYATRGAGKIFHHGATGAEDPDNPSFEQFFKMLPTRKSGPNYNGYTEGSVSKTSGDWGEHTEKMIDIDTVEWVEARMEEQWDRPLFLAAGIFRPHLPHYAPPAVFELYPFDETILPVMPKDDLNDVPPLGLEMAHTQFERYNLPATAPVDSPGSLKKLVQSYQASATFADSMVGRLIDKLDASGRADNTIIVLWADHGYHLGDKENCVKFTLWEKANHVPFIIVAPGVTTPGSRSDRPVSLVDLYPTLVELAGLPPKADNEGQSLVPLLKDPEQEWKRPAIMTQGRGNHAVRTDRWRYIRYQDGTEELYDHDNDAWEITNLAGDPKYADVIAEHKAWLPKDEAKEFVRAAQTNVERSPRPAAPSPATFDDPDALLIEDFEGESYGDWVVTGDAFGSAPARAGISPPPNKVTGYLGKGFVNSYLGGDASRGTLTSPPFTIEHPRINFLIGGGDHAGQTCMNLLVDGEVIRTATGPALKDAQGHEVLYWKTWKVAAFVGKRATIQIVDNASGRWGHINIDHIVQSEVAVAPTD